LPRNVAVLHFPSASPGAVNVVEDSGAVARAIGKAWQFLVRPRGSRISDIVLRSMGIVALLGIPLTFAFPRLVPLVWLAVLSLPASGPLGPIMPAALEPIVMEAAKYEKAIWVTLVALSTYVYMEYVNWHIYRWVLDRDVLSRLRDHPVPVRHDDGRRRHAVPLLGDPRARGAAPLPDAPLLDRDRDR
jgi:hypothetical protein